MKRTISKPLCRFAIGAVLLAALAAEAATPEHVLILRSFGRDFGPSHAMMPVLRAELARLVDQRPLTFQEASLDAERGGSLDDERSLVDFLLSRHRAVTPDLMIAVGAPALRFFERHRERLFPDVPLMLIAAERAARGTNLRPRDRMITFRIDLAAIVEEILQVLPDTKTVAVVVGSSMLEQFWLKQLRTDLAPFASRVELTWLSDVTIDELERRVAALPPHSAVFHFLFSVDSDGVPQEAERSLMRVRAASSAPVFGLFESQLGEGVMGGRMIDYRKVGIAAAGAAHAMLRAVDSAGSQVRFVDVDVVAFDWRELQRWGIPESRLPQGSEVRFRPLSLWQQHRLLILSGAAVVLLQAALITGLLVQRARRKRAEREAVDLAGRLLTAHEDERRHLARELHDDLTQRLARLAIDAGRIERGAGAAGDPAAIRQDLVRLSEDVHALSYRLHPSILDDLGLIEALRAECDRLASSSNVRVDVEARDLPDTLPPDAALCLFRVAQEALSNAMRHARPSAVTVLLAPSARGVQLAVSDNGSGFDPALARGRASLGLASMRERVRLLQGELDVESTPGRGTTVVAWVPAEPAGPSQGRIPLASSRVVP